MAECLIRIHDMPDGTLGIEWAWDSGSIPQKKEYQTPAHVVGQVAIKTALGCTNAEQKMNAPKEVK